MSRSLAALAVLLGVYGGIGLLSVGVKDHAHTIRVTGSPGSFAADKPGTIEIDFGYTTTFTVENASTVDIDFVLDAGPGGKCRVTFTPNDPNKCETPPLTIAKGGSYTFTGTAKDLPKDNCLRCVFAANCNYSCAPLVVESRPHFSSDIRVGESGRPLHKIDPDLEVERDPNSFSLIAIVLAILSALAAWLTRRRV